LSNIFVRASRRRRFSASRNTPDRLRRVNSPASSCFYGSLLRILLLRRGAAQDWPALVSFSRSVAAQHWALRPGEPGFHFIELAGVIDVLRLRGEQRNFVLYSAD